MPKSSLSIPAHAIPWFLGGLVVASFGLYRIVQAKGYSPSGFLLLFVGISILPFAIPGLLGGIGLLGLGGWLIIAAKGPYDYLVALIAVIIGVSRLAESWRVLKPKRGG